MRYTRAAAAPDGFSLVEMIVSMTLLAVIIGAALPLLTLSVRSMEIGADRAVLAQNAQFAASMLDRQLRTAGTNVLATQPWIVYAGTDVVAFHADYVSRIADPFAVYVDPDAPSAEVSAPTYLDRYTLPLTSFTYPDTTYWATPGVVGPAELVIFYFAPDTTTTEADDYILYRRVNSALAEVVSRRLLRAGATPFFEYYRQGTDAGGLPALLPVPAASLPLGHTTPVHLSPADTGAVAVIDSVRAVRFAFAATNARSGANARYTTRTGFVWLRNGGLATRRTCGDVPLFGSALTADAITVDDAPAVRLRWSAATDEQGGEEDVIRYVIWRTAPGDALADPFLSLPAGSATYEYIDGAVQAGDAWVYTIAAQDCTPTLSATSAGVAVIIP